MSKDNKQLALSTLKKYWGHDEFRSIQSDVVESVLNGNDTVAIASTGTGKALHKDTIIQTPYGVTMMKYLNVGDYVLGRDLKLTKVLAKYQPMTPDHYEITFDCGSCIKSCGDHLWLVNYLGKEEVVDTKFIYKSMLAGVEFTITGCPEASDINVHTILSIEPIEDNPEDYYCITVDNDDKLYLIGYKFIPTHNTVLYQVPSLILDGITLVISPLKALQKDQVESLEKKGIKAGVLNSDVGIRAKRALIKQLENKELKLLYIAPETLFSDSFLPIIPLLDVKLIAVDEAHCCSQWSDFRPKYQTIYKVNEIFPNAIKLAVTATADDLVIKDIVQNTGLKNNYKLFKGSVDRSNIEINIFKKTKDPSKHVIDVIKSFSKEEQGIIYCASREKSKQLSAYLNALGYTSVYYHAALSKKDKDKAQEDFTNKNVKIMCATIAFGMGIDIPDVRYIIHTDAPDSFESYQQQIGRASRIGNKAYAYLFYDPSSYNVSLWLNKKTTKDPKRLLMKNKKLKQFHEFCLSKTCRRKSLLKVFGEIYTEDNCGSCNICLNRKEF